MYRQPYSKNHLLRSPQRLWIWAYGTYYLFWAGIRRHSRYWLRSWWRWSTPAAPCVAVYWTTGQKWGRPPSDRGCRLPPPIPESWHWHFHLPITKANVNVILFYYSSLGNRSTLPICRNALLLSVISAQRRLVHYFWCISAQSKIKSPKCFIVSFTSCLRCQDSIWTTQTQCVSLNSHQSYQRQYIPFANTAKLMWLQWWNLKGQV